MALGLDFSEVGLADAHVWTEPEFKLEVDLLPNGKE